MAWPRIWHIPPTPARPAHRWPRLLTWAPLPSRFPDPNWPPGREADLVTSPCYH